MLHYNALMASGRKIAVVCAYWVGGANTTPLVLYFSAAHFAKRNVTGGGLQKRGRAKIHSPQPPFFLPARAFRIVCAVRGAASCQFLGISDKMSSSQTVKTHYEKIPYHRSRRSPCAYFHPLLREPVFVVDLLSKKVILSTNRGRSTVVVRLVANQNTRVRSPSPAQE